MFRYVQLQIHVKKSRWYQDPTVGTFSQKLIDSYDRRQMLNADWLELLDPAG